MPTLQLSHAEISKHGNTSAIHHNIEEFDIAADDLLGMGQGESFKKWPENQ